MSAGDQLCVLQSWSTRPQTGSLAPEPWDVVEARFRGCGERIVCGVGRGGRARIAGLDETAIAFGSNFAEQAGGINAARGGEAAVVVGHGKRPRVDGVLHGTLPVKRAHGIGLGLNLARSSQSAVSDGERNGGGNRAGTKEEEIIGHGHVLQVDGESVAVNLDGIIRNLDYPENSGQRRAGIEIVDLVPRTGVKEVESYQHKCARPFGRFRGAHAADRAFDADKLSLEDANVGADVVGVALTVGGGASGVSHGHRALKVVDAVGIGIATIKASTGAGKKGVDQRWKNVAAENGLRFNRPEWSNANCKHTQPEPEHLSAGHNDLLREPDYLALRYCGQYSTPDLAARMCFLGGHWGLSRTTGAVLLCRDLARSAEWVRKMV